MRIGISVNSSWPVAAGGDVREGGRRMVGRARAARAAGLDSLFVGDHHATPQPYFQNVAVLGRMLAEWGDRPAGALFLLPLWHPLLLAEQVGTLAALAEGPFILQCALGRDDEQYAAMGIPPRERVARFEAMLPLLRALWAGETVDCAPFWNLRAARISPRPPEPVAVWIGASAPVAIRRAARLGDGWLGAPGLTPEQARAALALYREAEAAAGRSGGVAAIRRDIHLADDAATARREVDALLARGYRGIDPAALVVGGPDEAEAAFRALAADGYSDVIVRNMSGDAAHGLQTLRVLGGVRARLAQG